MTAVVFPQAPIGPVLAPSNPRGKSRQARFFKWLEGVIFYGILLGGLLAPAIGALYAWTMHG